MYTKTVAVQSVVFPKHVDEDVTLAETSTMQLDVETLSIENSKGTQVSVDS